MTPAQQYTSRLRDSETLAAHLTRRHGTLGTLRVVCAVAFLAIGWGIGRYALPAVWLLLPAGAFFVCVLAHQQVRRRQALAARTTAFYADALARLDGRWPAHPARQPIDVQHHVYGGDLDLFGERSLYELLCAARTPMGERTLAAWLLEPADLLILRERQAGVAELAARVDFREAMGVHGDAQAIELDPAELVRWANAPNDLNHGWVRWVAPALVGAAAVTGLVWAIWGLSFPFIGILLVELALTYRMQQRVRTALAGVEHAHEDIRLIAVLLRRIEAEAFAAAPLRALQRSLATRSQGAAAIAQGAAATAQGAAATLSKLATVANFVEARRNPFLTPLLLPLLYPLLTALMAERWRAAHGAALKHWLASLGEMEALLSIARYHFDNPAQPFPEFVEGPARFRATRLGHPLIAPATRVSNDVDLSGTTRMLLVSGSNMSGKSTLLRSVGINTVLAMAGAPVCAERLQLTPLKIGASIRVNDSLHEGSSRFYAEITRLRQLFEPSVLPRLFLLDELLQGTNSSDRRIGAQGVVRALITRGGIGLISTHDLALTDITGLHPGALRNVHFQDELKDGVLTFDFLLQEGIVTKSNGIELMRSIGLEV